MPEIELKIRLSDAACLEPAAWYLPGDKTTGWIDQLAHWPADHTTLRLLVVRSACGTGVAGLVVVPNKADFTPSGSCIALGRLGEKLFLPVDAELFPALSPGELNRHFVDAYHYVWLPATGLTAAEPEDWFSVSDLLDVPASDGEDWGLAVPGVAFPNRLTAIFPISEPTFEQLIEDGRDGIGEHASELPELPKSPNEPLSDISGAVVRAAMLGAALPTLGAVKFLSTISRLGKGSRAGGSADQRASAGSMSSRGGFDGLPGLASLSQFANNLLNRASQSLEAQRHKEIGRLLHMLDSDPDKGLEFAIPFGGSGGAHRGRAPAGGRLGRRDADFSLKHIGGGAADFWDMSPTYQQKLVIKYRELAARETRLGRHRRAAYIYAELLGDLQSAASALEQGRQHREAAILYRDKLNNAQLAAECLEKGELWNEAVEAYRKLERYEKVGDLLTHIGQSEEATKAYYDAADQLKLQQDLIGAARIYEQKLYENQLAIDTLESGWLVDSLEKRCTAESFALYGRLGWHEHAKGRITQMAKDAETLGKWPEVAEMLADIFEKYPETAVQDASARLSRDLAVKRMQHAGLDEADRLSAVLARLSPNDKLLRRDGRRHVDALRAISRNSTAMARRERGTLKLLRQIDIGLPGVWKTAISLGELVIVAGVLEGRVVMARVHPSGRIEKNLTAWLKRSVPSEADLVLHGLRSPLRLFVSGEKALPTTQVFAASGPNGLGEVFAGSPRGLDIIWGAALGKTGHTWAIADREDPAMVCVDSRGNVIFTQSLLSVTDAYWDAAYFPLPMHVVRNRVLLGIGNALHSVIDGEVVLTDVLPSSVTSLAGGLPYSAPFLAAALESGVALIRDAGTGSSVEDHHIFAEDLQSPSVLMNIGGYLIAADSNSIKAYEWKKLLAGERSVDRCSAAKHKTGKPVAVLQGEQTDRVSVISDSGVISYYRIDP